MSTIHSTSIHFKPPITVGTTGQVLTASDNVGSSLWEDIPPQNFTFTNIQFVAKGGDDLNDGLTLGKPKLTIQAAWNVLNTIGNNFGLVWVLDSGIYEENLDLTLANPNQLMLLYGPNAAVRVFTGNAISFSDAGFFYTVLLNIGIESGISALDIQGVNSTVIIQDILISGHITNSGFLNCNSSIFVNPRINNSGTLTINATATSTPLITNTGFLSGTINVIGGATQVYGDEDIIGQLTASGLQYPTSDSTAGDIITTNGSGILSLQPPPMAALSWNGIAGTSQMGVVNNGYIVQNAAQTTITLPALMPLGSIIAIQGFGAGGWVLQANGGQTITLESSSTSSGGTITSTNMGDSVEVICVNDNLTWAVRTAVTSGFIFA